jgi:lysyl-tRNA synthetase class 2
MSKALREYGSQRLYFFEVDYIKFCSQSMVGQLHVRLLHITSLHQDLYLRISFELYRKRLLVGRLRATSRKLGAIFRNEGVSFKHNPEFTQLEFYMAYADYYTVMDMTEEMLREVAQKALGSTKFVYDGHEIDLAQPWQRLDLRLALRDACGIDIAEHPTAESLAKAMRARGIEAADDAPRGKLIDGLLGDFLEPKLIQPTFLIDYPRDISPLAKSKPGDPNTVERFEGFIGGVELCNAFTELNDPLDQQARFEEMGRTYAAEDEQRHPIDEDYLRAMRYGMPPNGGFGMGIDRLTMLFLDQPNIREVILFPHLRQETKEEE